MTTLVLLAGQSNMLGNRVPLPGAAPGAEVPGAVIWRRRQRRFAPLAAGSGYQKRGAGPEIGFAEAWGGAGGGPLALVKAARDGASLITQFDPVAPGRMFQRFVADSAAAMAALGVAPAGLVWMQGEFEARSRGNAAGYAARFAAFRAALWDALGIDPRPVVCGEISGHALKYPHADRVNAAFAQAGPGVAMIPTADLGRIDYVHYDADSLAEAGRRAARALRSALPPDGP